MPKMKSHSGAKKRFRKTATGKWKHKKQGLRHILTGMKAKNGRKLRRPNVLNEVQGKQISQLLPYA